MLFVVGELRQQIAWKTVALTAVFMFFLFAARFHRTGVTPERLGYCDAAPAIHLFTVLALTAE